MCTILFIVSIRETTSIRQSVRATLNRHGRVVLAVSGGLDSMVLLDAAAVTVSRDHLTVATFDHGTGMAATAARTLVEEFAATLGIECVTGRATGALSSEAEFRDARWRFLRGVSAATGAAVCTAHTEDDQVETVLMRVLRGAGARGLAGLYAESDIVRPLLRTRRRDLTRYARAQGLSWVEDPSNMSPRYFRNRVRHDLLPALRHVRPSIEDDLLAVARKAARWRDDLEIHVSASVEMRVVADGHGLDICAASIGQHTERELAALWPAIAARSGLILDRRGTARLAEFTKQGRVGARMQLAGGWQVTRSRDAFQLRASGGAQATAATLELSNATRWGDWWFEPSARPSSADSWSAWLPTDQPLSIRAWQAGDVMTAHGAGAPRKVKYFLSDAGVTGHERALWPVVLAGDQIVWIPGVRHGDVAPDRSGRPGLPFVCEYINR